MPVIEVHLIEGYDAAARTRLCEGLSRAVRAVIPAAPEAVTVMISEHARAGYMRGGVARDPAPALPDPVQTVRAFLAAMEARDLDAARAHLADGFSMHFPAAPAMHALAELVEWAKPRYRFVKKTYDGFDTAPADAGAVVYARGTLAGEWPDGAAFSGIRFIDRFEMAGGLIARQEVWNDIAETRAQGGLA